MLESWRGRGSSAPICPCHLQGLGALANKFSIWSLVQVPRFFRSFLPSSMRNTSCLMDLRLECRGNKIKSGCLEAKGQREILKSAYTLTKGWEQREGSSEPWSCCACVRRAGKREGEMLSLHSGLTHWARVGICRSKPPSPLPFLPG